MNELLESFKFERILREGKFGRTRRFEVGGEKGDQLLRLT